MRRSLKAVRDIALSQNVKNKQIVHARTLPDILTSHGVYICNVSSSFVVHMPVRIFTSFLLQDL